MPEPLERCSVHNVFHPKGPTCDPTQPDTANPHVEAVFESFTTITDISTGDHRDKIVPLTYRDEVVGMAWIDNSSGVITAQINSPMGNKLKDLITDGILDHISLDSNIQPAVPVTYDPRAPHSRACGIHSHNHGSECHPNCPTCHGI